MVKPTAPAGLELQPGEALFSNIVPDNSTKALSRYTDMVDQVIREESDKLQACSDDARVRLREWELPDVLYALDGQQVGGAIGVPESVKVVLEEIDQRGGLGYLHEVQIQLLELKRVSGDVLADADEELNQEEASEAKMRAQFGERWTRPQSTHLNKGLREKSRSLRDTLAAAAASDARVEQRLQECEGALGVLNVDSVQSMMPRLAPPMVTVVENEGAVAAALRNLVEELERVAAQRAGLEELLKEKKSKDDILPKLMAAPDPEELFKKELAKYDPIRAEVRRRGRLTHCPLSLEGRSAKPL
mmetsp:Transcript_40477/g.128995  ORF Transcript_40477/g.128995 Transcript_40477/m.128995 type:complete len:303 (-) Transcript_40477:379-1287(-)